VFLFAKLLQAIGFAHVGIGLYLGVAQNDMWRELYLGLSGLVFFAVGRLLEPRT
jgi:predicted cobalt transporter CbtA